MSQTAAMAANLSTSFNADTLADLAGKALEEGEEEQALPYLERGAKHFASPLLWQWKALLERSLDEHEAALASFEQAARQAPGDVSIAHGHARTAMEAGLDARPIYARALALAPRNGQIMVGAAAARVAMGEGERAIEDLMATLRGAPAWIYGHEQLAQIMATQGRASEATASLDQALASFPKAQPLWEALLNVQLRRGAYETLLPIVAKARSAGVDSPEFAIYEGIHAAEFEQDVRPPALFGAFPEAVDRALGRWRVRHLLRAGAIDALIPLIHEEMQRDRTAELWAYAATAWRLAGDPRSQWLEEDERLVSVADITADLPPVDKLTATFRALHVARGEYLDQSVRGGTQTDGPLLSRIDPTIRHLRRAIVGAVERHVAQLPGPDPSHPMLGPRRDRRVRFSGSWSVRLRSHGHHSNHVHPLGWISSALYLALPERGHEERSDAGWFTLGQPDEKLGIELEPWRKIQPKVGQLVLFPSWMWHGTVPFEEGERMTVAFDVSPPV
ncbi:putative 2OG-Fe(II) oxygenase [Sphingomonas daechungensis]|uniref:putative 2OG-Fe(II) oxygenase n=2 Tax=Sphingomonas daechungensis TaxID=1176646 RepID=UPI0031E90A36